MVFNLYSLFIDTESNEQSQCLVSNFKLEDESVPEAEQIARQTRSCLNPGMKNSLPFVFIFRICISTA